MTEALDFELRLRDVPPIDEDTARQLWVAVIKLAVSDLKKGPGKSKEQLRNYLEARTWFMSDDPEFPSFVCLCEHLDWDPGSIRRRLGDQLQR